jgi:hypothetical protein
LRSVSVRIASLPDAPRIKSISISPHTPQLVDDFWAIENALIPLSLLAIARGGEAFETILQTMPTVAI